VARVTIFMACSSRTTAASGVLSRKMYMSF
jgi:hypothetical protein